MLFCHHHTIDPSPAPAAPASNSNNNPPFHTHIDYMAKKAIEYSILVYVCAFHNGYVLEGWEVSHAYRVNSTISSTQKIPLDGPPLCVSATTSFTD